MAKSKTIAEGALVTIEVIRDFCGVAAGTRMKHRYGTMVKGMVEKGLWKIIEDKPTGK